MKTYKLIDLNGNTIESSEPGTLGGRRGSLAFTGKELIRN
jgi:hypothetical protein